MRGSHARLTVNNRRGLRWNTACAVRSTRAFRIAGADPHLPSAETSPPRISWFVYSAEIIYFIYNSFPRHTLVRYIGTLAGAGSVDEGGVEVFGNFPHCQSRRLKNLEAANRNLGWL